MKTLILNAVELAMLETMAALVEENWIAYIDRHQESGNEIDNVEEEFSTLFQKIHSSK